MLQTKINSLLLQKKEANYLKGDQTKDRLSDFTSSDNLLVYISSIDSYYYIYKKYNNMEKDFQLLIELFNYLDTLIGDNYNKISKILTELKTIINHTIYKTYNINIDNIFSST